MTYEFKHPSFYKKLKQQIKTELKNNNNNIKTTNNSNSTTTPKNNTTKNKLVKN